jgi:hypothetical protein
MTSDLDRVFSIKGGTSMFRKCLSIIVLVATLLVAMPAFAGGTHWFFSFNIPFGFGWAPYAYGPWPYPSPYVSPYAYPYSYPIYSPPIVVQPQPAPTASWYYCENPQGYYPYVPQCPSGWRAVSPTPR